MINDIIPTWLQPATYRSKPTATPQANEPDDVPNIPDIPRVMPKRTRSIPKIARYVALGIAAIALIWLVATGITAIMPKQTSFEDKAKDYISATQAASDLTDEPVYKERPTFTVIEVVRGNDVTYLIFDKDKNLLSPRSMPNSSIPKRTND